MKKEKGIHTFSLTANSSYIELQNLLENGLCILKWRDYYRLNATYEITKFKDVGVEILLHQSLARPSWIKLIVNPSSLLQKQYCPTTLFHDPHQIHSVQKKLRKILNQCGINYKLKAFRLSRCDLTEDRYYESKEELMERLRIFKKSFVMSPYCVVLFEGSKENAKTLQAANAHSWTIGCKSCAFSVYNKTYELKERHGIDIEDQILRLELRLKRKRICQLVKGSSWEKQLKALCSMQDKLVGKFLHRIRQDYQWIVTKDMALQMVEKSSFREQTQKKLCKLITLADESESLTAVQKKMRIKKENFKDLLDRFYKLGINPIPLRKGRS